MFVFSWVYFTQDWWGAMVVSLRRAVITGVGSLTPLGNDGPSFHSALKDRKSGVSAITSFDVSTLPVRFAGCIPDFDAKNYVDKKDRKALRVMAKTIQLAVSGAQCAINDSKVDKEKLDRTRFGVIYGAGLIATELNELADAAIVSSSGDPIKVDLDIWGHKGLEVIQPLWMLKYLPNMLACQVSILHDAQGPNNSITQSDVASVLALGETFRLLCRDRGDFFLAGGAESRINILSLTRNSLFEELSTDNENPQKACRPFDKNRNGMVIGEGAGVLAVEELEHAKNRGAKIYAEILGFGAAFDQKKDGSGVARAINAALKEAAIDVSDIDHVNAHGLGCKRSDRIEAQGIRSALPKTPDVLAVKSAIGNLGAAGGLVELIASLESFQSGIVPGTLNFENADPDCPVPVLSASRELRKNCVLKVSMGQTGQCGAVVIRRWM